jgi:DNA-binding transcriptional ArsR family regulator
MTENHTNNFVECLISLTRLILNINDPFFNQKIYSKLGELIKNNQSAGDNQLAVQKSADDILEILEYLEHLKMGDTGLLLLARQNLLKYKLEALKQLSSDSKSQSSHQSDQIKKIRANRTQPMAEGVISTKSRVISFIKQTPNVRTAEIMSEFSLISRRTIMRVLKELTEEGMLDKKVDHRSVYYSAK